MAELSYNSYIQVGDMYFEPVGTARSTDPTQNQQSQSEAVLTALEELVPDVLTTHAATESKARRDLHQEEAEALSRHVISSKLRCDPPVRLKQACNEAIIELNDLLTQAHEELPIDRQFLLLGVDKEGKNNPDCTANECEEKESPVSVKLAATRAPILIALEVIREPKSERQALIKIMAQDVLALLEVATAEKEELNGVNLIKLMREVAAERRKVDLHMSGNNSSEYIAKIVVRQFCVPAAIKQAVDRAKLDLSVKEVGYLRKVTVKSVGRGKEVSLAEIVQQELNTWMDTRDKVNHDVQAKLAPVSASGLKWLKKGHTHGQHLENSMLAEALKRKTEFTPQEWGAFGIETLRMDHHVKSGTSFFEPDVSEFGLRRAPITSTAIHAVLDGSEISAAVDMGVNDERLGAAVRSVADKLRMNLSTNAVEKLKRELAAQIPASGLQWVKLALPAGGKQRERIKIFGRDLKDSKLAAALARHAGFTQHEWEELGITDLCMDHYSTHVEFGAFYFKPANPSSLDDETLLAQTEEALKKVRNDVIEAIKLQLQTTAVSSLTDKELEDIVGSVTAAMETGLSLEHAVRDALPTEQSIWDTAQNSAARRDAELKFAPLKRTEDDKRKEVCAHINITHTLTHLLTFAYVYENTHTFTHTRKHILIHPHIQTTQVCEACTPQLLNPTRGI